MLLRLKPKHSSKIDSLKQATPVTHQVLPCSELSAIVANDMLSRERTGWTYRTWPRAGCTKDVWTKESSESWTVIESQEMSREYSILNYCIWQMVCGFVERKLHFWRSHAWFLSNDGCHSIVLSLQTPFSYERPWMMANLDMNWGNKLLAFHLDYKQAAKKDCTQGEERHIWVVPWDMMSYTPNISYFDPFWISHCEAPPRKAYWVNHEFWVWNCYSSNNSSDLWNRGLLQAPRATKRVVFKTGSSLLYTPEDDIAPARKASQKETSLPSNPILMW